METQKKLFNEDDKLKDHFDYLIVDDRGVLFGAALLSFEAEAMKKALEKIWCREEIELKIVQIANNSENL